MDEHLHESVSVTPGSSYLKRKRGRPRKDRTINYEAYSPSPCGEGLATNVLRHIEPRPAAQLVSVGQPVGGVIEAVFDAGYLLNVELSAGTTLRGVIFKPGHYVPFSDENDVAPYAQLIRRNEVLIPSGTQNVLHGSYPVRKRRRRQKPNGNGNSFSCTFNGAPVDNLPVIAASPISSRCNFVPVVLRPTLVLPNGIRPLAIAPPVVSSISKQLSSIACQGPLLFNELVPDHLNQVLPYQQQNNLHCTAAASTGNLSAIPFQQLLDEVIKRTKLPPSAKTVQNQASDPEEPLSAEPLQAIQPNPHSNRPLSDGKQTREGKVMVCQISETNSQRPLWQNGKNPSFSNDGSSGAELGGRASFNSIEDSTPGRSEHGYDDAAHSDGLTRTVSD
uniref:AT hook motif-containing protein n=1 Tax=Kalanchoe fedtschenkoi TaxID=63787 RepID=A0A7N0VB56_KALFE